MTRGFSIYCPYCGKINGDDEGLLQLQGEVYSFLCKSCDKSAILALYEIEIFDFHSSVTKVKENA